MDPDAKMPDNAREFGPRDRLVRVRRRDVLPNSARHRIAPSFDADLASGRGRGKGAAAPGPDDRTRRQGRETIPRRPRNRNAPGGRQEPGSAAGGKTGTGMETTNGKKTGRDQRDDRNRTMKP